MSAAAETPNGAAAHGHQSFWLWVMCLTGVDYFSTLGYQPSIAFEATGLLTPFATAILVGVTLFGAFPVYAYVAGKSPHGQGSISMLERLVHGWGGHAGQMLALAQAVAAEGFTPVLLEMPAHGRSAGTVSNLPQFARAIDYVAARLVQQGAVLQAVVAHSLGANALAYAADEGQSSEPTGGALFAEGKIRRAVRKIIQIGDGALFELLA